MTRRFLRWVASQQASVASLGTAALLAFVALVGFQGWRGYEQAQVELAASVGAHARLMSEHLERTLQTVEIVFDSVIAEVGVRPWEDVAGSRAFHERLRSIAASLPQMRSLWVTDQNGYMRAYSDRWPTPRLDAFDREYYTVHALDGVTTLFPGKPMNGKFTGRPFVPVSVPLVVGVHSFRGVVTAAVEPAYYLPLLSSHGACVPCRTAFFRPDGQLLFSTGAGGALDDGVVEGVSQLIVSDTYPLVVAVWAPQSAVLGLWWQREKSLLIAGLAASLLLTWLLVRAIRSSRTVAHERDSLQRLAETLAARNGELDEARAMAESARRLERRLREEAAAANLAKSRFLALMSHELRTPLNAIIGFSELIRERAAGLRPDRVAEYAADIHGSGKHLLSLINDILDLSKIEAGRFELEEEELDLREILEDAVRMMSVRFGDKRLQTSCALPGIALRGDRRALKQVLLNVLSNAAKFTPEGGRIAVAAALDAEGVRLTVADDGCGMSQADLERAMEAFRQGASPLVRSSEGTGLGLNITKALVELHGGTMALDSAPGHGTTVEIRLPRSRLISAPLELAAAR